MPRSLGSTVCHAPPNTYVPLCDTDTLRYVTNKTRQNGLQTADRQEGGEGTVTRGTPERKSAWQDCQPNLPAVILTTTLLPAWVLPREVTRELYANCTSSGELDFTHGTLLLHYVRSLSSTCFAGGANQLAQTHTGARGRPAPLASRADQTAETVPRWGPAESSQVSHGICVRGGGARRGHHEQQQP